MHISVSGLPMKKYLMAHGISASLLKEFCRSPRHYQWALERKFHISTAALDRGTRLHAALEDWEHFQSTHTIAPKLDRRTKEGRLAYQEWEAEQGARQVLSPEDWADVVGMRESLFAEPKIRAYLEDFTARREVTWRWRNPPTGLDCKCRTDLEAEDQSWVLDYKTCQDASPEGFRRSIRLWSYDLSAVHYMEGTECRRYGWIAVESKPPYACCLYWLNPFGRFQDVEDYRLRKLEELNLYISQWGEETPWPSYEGGESSITL